MREEAMLPDKDREPCQEGRDALRDGKEGSCPSILPAPDKAH